MPEVYKWDNKNYDMNGDMTIQPSYAILKIELNGICEIEIEHPYDKLGRWKYLIEDAVVAAPTPWSKKQLFRIYDTEKTLTGLKVYARHIYFDLVKSNIESNMHIKNKNGQEALEMILKDTGYTSHSNIVIINNCHFFKDNVIQGISGSQENTFLKRWSGEIFLDNFDVYVNRRIGGDYGVRVSYANNMEDLNLKRNMEGVFTRLQPYVIKNTTDTIELPEKYVDSPSIDKFAKVYEKYIDLSEYMHLKENEDDIENAYETEKELHVAMRDKCKELFKEGLDKPKVTGSVNMILLENTIEYEHVKELVRVNLGDDVKVEHLDIGIETQTRCVGYTWNILTERYMNINLGELESDYFDIQSSTTNDLKNVLNDNGTLNPAKMQGLIDGLKTKFNVYRDIEQKLQIRAMLFEDKIKGSATYGAMALGTMGFEIASERTPDDRDWDWRTFGTGAGFTADYINVGTLNANLIKAGILSAIVIQDIHETFTMDLREEGSLKFKNNGNLAMEFIGNELRMFNWANKKEYIGSLVSLATLGSNKIPYIGLTNEKNSGVEIAYRISNGNFMPYILFDKYNVKGDQYYPISVKEHMSVERLYTGSSSLKNLPYIWGIENYMAFSKNNKSLMMLDFGNSEAQISGDFSVFGNKNCIQRTKEFGNVPFYANEDINSLLTKTPVDEILETTLQNTDSYKCIVKISNMIRDCVNTDLGYNVWITKLGQGDIWVSNTYPGHFVVESDKPIRFKYKLEGRRKGFEEMGEALTLKKAYETKVKRGVLGGTSKEGNSTN